MTIPVPDALIFDLDGVIVDSYAAVTHSINAALQEHGLAARPQAQLRRYIGPPTLVGFRELTGAPAGSPQLEAIVASFHRRYGEVYLTQTRAMDGIAAALAELAARIPLAVATSKSAAFTQPLLEQLELERFFVFVAAAAHEDESDDKTAIVGRALAALQARGCRAAAMVGDRSFDVEAARAHGLPAIGVSWGIGSAEELRAAGAQVLLAQPRELVMLLEAEGRSGG